MSTDIRSGVHLRAAFWPEPVRVLTAAQVGNLFRIEVVGESGRFYGERWLRPEDFSQIEVLPEAQLSFTGRGEAAFLTLEAHRIRLSYQFDPLQAVHVSQVDPLPHQIDAVYHHMLHLPRLRFLLADDPGAGKTIMAGLLLKELKYRGLAERTLIVVPGHLRDQWIRELKERFGETFRVVDRPAMDGGWGRNIWLDHAQVITSMDFAKQDDVLASLAKAEWDLVIVDEAHKLAAYRYGERTKKTQRYRLGEVLARTSHHLLFLTATPHRGDPENFRLLLNLLEPDLFADLDILAEAVRYKENFLFLRRLKENLKTFDGVPIFPPRHVHTVVYQLSPEEAELYRALTRYVREQYNLALAQEKRNVAFALLILQRRLASSVRAARRSLERRRNRLSELLKLGKWLAERGQIDEEDLEDAPELDRWRKEEELIERLTAARTREELERELSTLDGLIGLARALERQEVETKLGQLRRLMGRALSDSDEKLLIFTESRDTMVYLAEHLSTWGYSVVTLHGGMDLDERIRAEHIFRDQAQVMVSTEAGGEGINLQFCSLMVNYDIPWNPNRLEQRMGRIHRYGQQKEVHIYNLVTEDTVEGRVLTCLFDKLLAIQKALGSDRVFDVIQEVIPGRSLAELIVEAISGRRTMDEIAAEIERIPDEEALRRAREAALEALATRHIDLASVLGEERKAREQRLVPEYIEAFFHRACEFSGLPLERRQDGLWRLSRVPYKLRRQPRSFYDCHGEVQESYRRFSFYKEEARHTGAEFVAPGHSLLEAMIEEVLGECEADLRAGAAFSDPSGQFRGTIWFVTAEIQDGNGAPAACRLFAVYQPTNGGFQLVHPGILWDLVPASQVPSEVVPLDTLPICAYVAENLLPELKAWVQAEREREAQVKQRYGLRSLDQLIGEAEAALLELETRRAKGEDIPEPLLRGAQRRREELEERKKRLAGTIERETSLLPGEIRVLGAAAVHPIPEPNNTWSTDPAIEAIGMRVAVEYELGQGRTIEDVSAQNLGYDICSIASPSPAAAGQGEDVRYIEVKARAKTGPIVITPNEWLMAKRLGGEYWLYVVENAATHPELHRLKNPASVLQPEERVEVVRYIVRDWRDAAM